MKNKNLKDSYQKYLTTTESPVPLKEYLDINAAYNKFLINKVLEGEEVTLPSRLGTLSIQGRKPKIRMEDGQIRGLSPDWVKTKKLWEENEQARLKKQLVYHTNSHTDGYRFKWHWSKLNVLVENKTLYALRVTRANKRAVHKKILEGVPYKTKN